jgi:hypothetical protein
MKVVSSCKVFKNLTDMKLEEIFEKLWNDYIAQNPSAGAIYNLFRNEGEEVVNDHIAFRTLDLPEIGIDVLAQPFIKNGYIPRGSYDFDEKHLFARHFEKPDDPSAPRIFISQLKLPECSEYVRDTLTQSVKEAGLAKFNSNDLIFKGQIFSHISFEVYNNLRKESEYAAWFYVFGFRANHFTVSVNALKRHPTLEDVNDLLKKNGFNLNDSGGEIKGTLSDLLRQSSTLADTVRISFAEGSFLVPCCYYEFAQRYPDANGKLYNGFVAKSADKIFESTNFYKK